MYIILTIEKYRSFFFSHFFFLGGRWIGPGFNKKFHYQFFLHPFPIHLLKLQAELQSLEIILPLWNARWKLPYFWQMAVMTMWRFSSSFFLPSNIDLAISSDHHVEGCGGGAEGGRKKCEFAFTSLNRDLYIWSQVNVNDESPLHVLHYSTQIYLCKKAQSVRPWQHPEQASNWGPILSWVISSARQVCCWQNQGLHRIDLAGNR